MTPNDTDRPGWIAKLDRALVANSRWLFLLFAGSFLLKALYVIQSANALHVTVPIMDSAYYYRQAQDIVAGHLLHRDGFFMGPLYPHVLAIVIGLVGKNIMAIRIAQILGGSLVVVLTYLIGKQVFRPSTALLAALLLMFYGTITFYEGQLLMMWLGTILNMTVLYVLYRRRADEGMGKYVLIGLLIGASALARANILLFGIALIGWIIFVSRENRRVVKALVFMACVVGVILPATIHNYIAGRDFVPITSNAGVNFFIGNSYPATGIFYPPRSINLVTDDAVKIHVERILGRELKPSEVSRYWWHEAFDFIRSYPGMELRLLLRKTALFFNGYEMPQIEAYGIARQRYGTLRLLFVRFWWIITLALTGMIYLRKDWRKHFLLYGYVVTFSISIIMFFVTSRYRVQIVPVLSLFAAHTLLDTVPAAVRNARHSLAPLLLIGGLLLATRPAWFALPSDDVAWREHTHEARRLSEIGKHAEAIAEVNKAIEVHPDYLDSYLQRAVIYKAKGDYFNTISDFSKVIKINPNLPTVQYDLGQALRQMQMYEPAIEAYLKAIELDPRMLPAYNNLGITYRETKSYEEAVRYFEKVIEMNPRYIKAYNNLGASYAEMGRPDRAIDVLTRAIQRDPTYVNSYKNLAMAYIQSQNIQAGFDTMSRYLELAPDDDQAKEIVEKLRSALLPDSTGVR